MFTGLARAHKLIPRELPIQRSEARDVSNLRQSKIRNDELFAHLVGGGHSLETAKTFTVNAGGTQSGLDIEMGRVTASKPAAAPIVSVVSNTMKSVVFSLTKPVSDEPIIGYELYQDPGSPGGDSRRFGENSLSYEQTLFDEDGPRSCSR